MLGPIFVKYHLNMNQDGVIDEVEMHDMTSTTYNSEQQSYVAARDARQRATPPGLCREGLCGCVAARAEATCGERPDERPSAVACGPQCDTLEALRAMRAAAPPEDTGIDDCAGGGAARGGILDFDDSYKERLRRLGVALRE